MRTKSKAAHERTEDMERTLEDEEGSNRKAKTFSEMMSERWGIILLYFFIGCLANFVKITG